MSDFKTVSFRLTPVLLVQIDAAAAIRGMTRSDWMRDALVEILRDELRQDAIAIMGQKLVAKMDDLQAKLAAHVTQEIDSLTRN